MRREIPWSRANSELYEGHYFSQFMVVAACTHTPPESRPGALASELLNLNSHVESFMHGRNSISNKSLPRDSFLGMEIGDVSYGGGSILGSRTILESLCNSHFAVNFLPAYWRRIDFPEEPCIFYHALHKIFESFFFLSKIFRVYLNL